MDVVLNEVLYDPAGADGGYEFVEFVGVGPDSSRSLAGWVLETANGADGVWRVAWQGTAEDRLVGGRFVVGESGVEPVPDAVRELDLQNGPDACRLRAPDGAVDVLGWGEPLPPELFEGSPASDVAGGESLARRPDGVDRNDNGRDWFGAEPTPGGFNSPEIALALTGFVREGESPAAFRCTVHNVGRVEWSGAIEVRCAVHPGERIASVATAVAPAGSSMVWASAGAPEGIHVPFVAAASARSEYGAIWRGAGADLVISEVYNRPPPDEPEWIELTVAGTRPVALRAFTWADAAGTEAELTGEPAAVLVPGEYFVVAEDSLAFRARFGAGARVGQPSRWPSLNHSGGDPVEEVELAVAGELVERASVPPGNDEGVSWERVSFALAADAPRAWGVCLRGATPGRENSRAGDRAVPVASSSLSVWPSPFRPESAGAAVVVWKPERAGERGPPEFVVYDSAGRTVAELPTWFTGTEWRALWDGRTRDSPARLGLYFVHGAGAVAPVVLIR